MNIVPLSMVNFFTAYQYLFDLLDLLTYLKHTFLHLLEQNTKSLEQQSVTRCPEHEPTYDEEELEDHLTQQPFNDELQKDIAVMLTQEEFDEEATERNVEEGGAEDRAGEDDDDDVEDNDDEDEEEGYESPRDPFPREARRRLTEEELDKDFDPNEEVGIKP